MLAEVESQQAQREGYHVSFLLFAAIGELQMLEEEGLAKLGVGVGEVACLRRNPDGSHTKEQTMRKRRAEVE